MINVEKVQRVSKEPTDKLETKSTSDGPKLLRRRLFEVIACCDNAATSNNPS